MLDKTTFIGKILVFWSPIQIFTFLWWCCPPPLAWNQHILLIHLISTQAVLDTTFPFVAIIADDKKKMLRKVETFCINEAYIMLQP